MSDPGLSARENHLIELLADGHTDATAARELGVSERTVSTLVRSMMDRFGVDNRFQLGLAIGATSPETLPAGVPSAILHGAAGDPIGGAAGR